MFDEGQYREFVGDTKARMESLDRAIIEHKEDIQQALQGIRIELSNVRARLENLPTNGGWKKPAMYAGGGGISFTLLLEFVRSLFIGK